MITWLSRLVALLVLGPVAAAMVLHVAGRTGGTDSTFWLVASIVPVIMMVATSHSAASALGRPLIYVGLLAAALPFSGTDIQLDGTGLGGLEPAAGGLATGLSTVQTVANELLGMLETQGSTWMMLAGGATLVGLFLLISDVVTERQLQTSIPPALIRSIAQGTWENVRQSDTVISAKDREDREFWSHSR